MTFSFLKSACFALICLFIPGLETNLNGYRKIVCKPMKSFFLPKGIKILILACDFLYFALSNFSD